MTQKFSKLYLLNSANISSKFWVPLKKDRIAESYWDFFILLAPCFHKSAKVSVMNEPYKHRNNSDLLFMVLELNQKWKFTIRLFFQYLAQSVAAFTAVARSSNQASCKEKTQSLQIITSTTTSRAVEAQSEDRQEGAIKQCVCYSYYLPLLYFFAVI